MENNNLKWGIVGTGYIANRFARNLVDEKMPIIAVSARNFEKTQVFAKKYQIATAYKDIDELLADSKVDAIYIGTPNNTHFDFIKRSLMAGKHVLCEKPMVINEKQFLEVKNLAAKKHLILEEAYTPLHMPLTHKIKELIMEGKIGKIKMIQANFADRADLNPKGRLLNLELGGGALLDIGCYPLCFALQYLDKSTLKINTQVIFLETDVDVAENIQLANKNQVANLSASFLNKMPKDGIISGEQGYIQVKHFSRAEKARIVLNNGKTIDVKVGNSEKAWYYEACDFQRYVEQGHDDGELDFSHYLIQIMDKIRLQWNLKYPFEG